MSYERSKAPLALMEQIIMILVFALAAAACLQAFVYARNLSLEGEKRDAALVHIQEVAEYTKSVHGDMDAVKKYFLAETAPDGIKVSYPEEKMELYMSVKKENKYLEKAKISVKDTDGNIVHEITAAWQTGEENET